ncbi:MAG: tetraacyldisaccharide 4'-kinase [Bacteroidales bacterium]|nr:tetraacyldisaccharide 4'-kinase [Bacteroidales bacterium]
MGKGILLPFSWLYGALVKWRNYLYDKGIKKSARFDIPIICIGNITVGGTGKTPMSEYLIRLLSASFQTSLLSRGYRRRSRGFVMATESSSACDIGDEPLQIHRKFPDITVAVQEKRAEGIRHLRQVKPDTEVILLDDAFQHRAVKPSLSLLVIDYGRPVFDDCLLPAGRLREPVQGMKRADIIVVSKCPENLSEGDRQAFVSRLRPEKGQGVFFSHIRYTAVLPAYPDKCRFAGGQPSTLKESGIPLLAFCGIGSPQSFSDYIRQLDERAEVITFPDHHRYTDKDIQHLVSASRKVRENNGLVITTEKDFCRLPELPLAEELASCLCYLSMEVKFSGEQETLFNQMITKHVRTFSTSCRMD